MPPSYPQPPTTSPSKFQPHNLTQNTITMEKFETLKTEILKRAKKQSACKEQYARALKSSTYQELLQVVKDNFSWAVTHKIIDAELLGEYKQEFNDNDIWCNESASTGFLLTTDSATVRAYDSATVRAYDSATVEATGSATVRAYGSATVEAYGSATVEATGSSYCISYFTIECKLSMNAIYRVLSTNTIYTATDSELSFKEQPSTI